MGAFIDGLIPALGDERRESLGVPAVTSQVFGAPEEERCGQQVKWMSVIVVRARRLDALHCWLILDWLAPRSPACLN